MDYVVPFIAIVSKDNGKVPVEYKKLDFDAIIYADFDEEDILRSLRTLSLANDKIYSQLITKRSVHLKTKSVISYFSPKNNQADFEFLDDTKIIFNDESSLQMDDVNLFLLDIDYPELEKYCATIRLSKLHRHKPILLVFHEDKNRALSILSKGIGITDIIDINLDETIVSCKINAFIKHQKLLKEFYQKVEHNFYLASVDVVTGTYNRTYLEEYIDTHEYADKNSTVLMIDIDNFKEINDKYGHNQADNVLKGAAHLIKTYLRISDIVTRYGGDEFVVIMNNVSKDESLQIANRIREKIATSPIQNVWCTVSIGLCSIDNDKTKLNEAISIADGFMYLAKKQEGNIVSAG